MDRKGAARGEYRYGSNGTVVIALGRRFSFGVSSKTLLVVVGVVLAFVLAVILVLTNGIIPWTDGDVVRTRRAYLMAGVTMLFVVGVLHLAGKASNDGRGLAYLVQGSDRRASTSKIQYLLWTFGVAFALAYILFRVVLNSTRESFECSATRVANCVSPDNWEQYLILLGVPAATAVVAKAVNSYKVVQGNLQKTTAESASLSDVATNDNGQVDLADTQYLIFNIVAFVYVAVNFVRRGVLVEVPDVLLGLTSAAAATYVLNKSLQNNRPVIASVEPSVVSPGTAVTVRGRNLFPAGASDEVTVTIGGINTTGTRVGETVKVAKAPSGMSESDATVSVTTAANVTTDKYPITVVNLMSIVGTVDGPPRANADLELWAEGLPDEAGKALVMFGSTVVDATLENGLVSVRSPDGLRGDVEVKLGYQGRWSPVRTLTFD